MKSIAQWGSVLLGLLWCGVLSAEMVTRRWGHSLGTPPPPTLELIAQIRRGRAVPAFANCTINDNSGDGRHGEDRRLPARQPPTRGDW